MHPDWATSVVKQCLTAGTPVFFKQWGEWQPITVDDRHGETHGIRESLCCWVHPDGQWWMQKDQRPCDFAWPMMRAGKKSAGHLLDGQEWRQMPEVKQ